MRGSKKLGRHNPRMRSFWKRPNSPIDWRMLPRVGIFHTAEERVVRMSRVRKAEMIQINI